jgi:hypothetical protein
MTTPGKLAPQEYERRRVFHESLKGLTKAEYVEILRLLNKHEEPYSENLNGVFFNVCNVSQVTFDALELFLEFTHSNRKDLADREKYLSSLMVVQAAENTVIPSRGCQ